MNDIITSAILDKLLEGTLNIADLKLTPTELVEVTAELSQRAKAKQCNENINNEQVFLVENT